MKDLTPVERMRAIAALAVAVVLWASAFIAIRAIVTVGAYTAGQLSFFRLLVASACLGVLALVRGGIGLPKGRDWVAVIALGASGQMMYHLLLNTGERSVAAGTASLLVSVAPLMASVIAVVVLGERMGPIGWLGTGVAFTGAAMIATSAGVSLDLSSGALLVSIATCLWAAYLVIQKTASPRLDAYQLTAWPMWIGCVLLLPTAGGLPQAVARAPFSATASVVWLGAMCSVAGFLAYSYAGKRLPVVVSANALCAVPAVAFVIGLVVLGEHPGALALAGGALSIAGVSLAQSLGKHREKAAVAVGERGAEVELG